MQAKIARYHVDVFLPEVGTVVEVDGPWHLTDEVSRSDLARDAELRSLGCLVVRIPSEQVRADPQSAARYVLEEMKRRKAGVSTFGIAQRFHWTYCCPACFRRYTAKEAGQTCHVCGTALERKPLAQVAKIPSYHAHGAIIRLGQQSGMGK
jgi:hypothetical protein